MTANFAARAQAAIAAAKTTEEVARSADALTYLRDDRTPESEVEMCFVHGSLDWRVSSLVVRGADSTCRLRVSYQGQILFGGKVNLESQRARRELASRIVEATGLERAMVDADLLALPDLARSQMATMLGSKADKPVHVMTEDERRDAEALLRDPRLLERLDEICDHLRIVAEHHNRLLVYLTCTSRLLDAPLNIIVKGESSAGKSYVANRILHHLFPSESYEMMARYTAQALYYFENDDYLKHKVIAIFEQTGAEQADYALRVMQSEQQLSVALPIKDPRSGKMVTQVKVMNGPAAFIVTTTLANVNIENETRNLDLFADETQTQTQRIVEKQAEWAAEAPPDVPAADLLLWQNAQRLLKKVRVKIPFAPRIARQFPTRAQRSRRDFPKLLTIIEALAMLHQYQRQVKTDGNGEYIEATIDDYGVARWLSEPTFQRTMSELGPRSVAVLNHCLPLRFAAGDDLGAITDASGRPLRVFTYRDLAPLGWKESTLKKWLYPLFDYGYLERVEDAKRSGGRSRQNRFVCIASPSKARVLAEIGDVFGAPNAWKPPQSWLKWPFVNGAGPLEEEEEEDMDV